MRSSEARRRLLAIGGIGIGIIAVAGLAYGIAFWARLGAFPGDTLTYYLAGLRLNTGHALYDLVPGDVWLYGRPDYPLYGPPLVAVIWRPLAAIPDGWGMVVWLVLMDFAATLAVLYVLLGTRGWAGLLVLPLVPSLTLLTGVGNVDAVVLLGVLAAWSLGDSGHPRAAGVLVGFLASLKLTPGILIIWLIATRRWTSIAWAIGTGLVLAVVVLVGTEPGIWVRYLRVLSGVSADGGGRSLLVVTIGTIGIVLLRRWPRASFALSAALMPLGSPVAAGHTWSLLLAVVGPFVRPLKRGGGRETKPHATEGNER